MRSDATGEGARALERPGPTTHPQRWHVYLVEPDPCAGPVSGAHRAGVVVQPDGLGDAGIGSTVVLALALPAGPEACSPTRVRIPPGACGLPDGGEVLVDRVLVWDNARFRADLGRLPEAVQDQVWRAMQAFLAPR